MDTRNHEHYKDKTAHDAIKAADKPPDSVTRTINAMKAVAAIDEFEVFGLNSEIRKQAKFIDSRRWLS